MGPCESEGDNVVVYKAHTVRGDAPERRKLALEAEDCRLVARFVCVDDYFPDVLVVVGAQTVGEPVQFVGPNYNASGFCKWLHPRLQQ